MEEGDDEDDDAVPDLVENFEAVSTEVRAWASLCTARSFPCFFLWGIFLVLIVPSPSSTSTITSTNRRKGSKSQGMGEGGRVLTTSISSAVAPATTTTTTGFRCPARSRCFLAQ